MTMWTWSWMRWAEWAKSCPWSGAGCPLWEVDTAYCVHRTWRRAKLTERFCFTLVRSHDFTLPFASFVLWECSIWRTQLDGVKLRMFESIPSPRRGRRSHIWNRSTGMCCSIVADTQNLHNGDTFKSQPLWPSDWFSTFTAAPDEEW